MISTCICLFFFHCCISDQRMDEFYIRILTPTCPSGNISPRVRICLIACLEKTNQTDSYVGTSLISVNAPYEIWFTTHLYSLANSKKFSGKINTRLFNTVQGVLSEEKKNLVFVWCNNSYRLACAAVEAVEVIVFEMKWKRLNNYFPQHVAESLMLQNIPTGPCVCCGYKKLTLEHSWVHMFWCVLGICQYGGTHGSSACSDV